MGACQSGNNQSNKGNGKKGNRNTRRPMIEWDVDDVIIWLSTVCDGELKSLVPKFKQKNITGEILQNLTDAEIRKLVDNEYLESRLKLLRTAQLSLIPVDSQN